MENSGGGERAGKGSGEDSREDKGGGRGSDGGGGAERAAESGAGRKGRRWVFGGDAETAQAAPGVVRKVLAYCDGMMCVENRFESGAVGAVHSHPHTQLTYVAEGSFEFTIGEETRVVRKGDAMLKQDGVRHGCVCLEAGVLVDVFSPMREDFL